VALTLPFIAKSGWELKMGLTAVEALGISWDRNCSRPTCVSDARGKLPAKLWSNIETLFIMWHPLYGWGHVNFMRWGYDFVLPYLRFDHSYLVCRQFMAVKILFKQYIWHIAFGKHGLRDIEVLVSFINRSDFVSEYVADKAKLNNRSTISSIWSSN